MARATPALCVLLLLLPAGCNDTAPERSAVLASTLTDPADKPLDHLAAGELLPGTEKAFALVLPRGFTVRARFVSSVLAEGPASAVNLGHYLAARVKDGKASVQPAQALFEGVRAPEEPARLLRIRVEETAPGFCQLQVNDDTPPPDPGGDVAERLERIGRRPDGKLEGREKME